MVATFLHFLHNAVNLAEYPGLPESWRPLGVLASWLPVGALGVYGLREPASRRGRKFLWTFAILGFAGFLHFLFAPARAHEPMMLAAIGLEACTGLLLVLHLWRSRGEVLVSEAR